MDTPNTSLPDNSAWARKAAYVLWLAFAAVACAVSIWAHLQIGMDNDHMSLVDQTRKLLAGAKAYVDYNDVNPPLIHLILVIPVLINKWTQYPMYEALNLFALALVALSLIVSHRLLRHSGATPMLCWLVVSTLALALLAASFVHQPFADREHFVMVLGAPWFVLYSPLVRRDAIPKRWRMTAAAMAAVGFAIKPYFYIFYAATLPFAATRRPILRDLWQQTEQRIVWGFAAVYLLIVLAFFSEYVFTVIPLGLVTYSTYGWSMPSKLHVLWYDLLGGYGWVILTGLFLLWLSGLGLIDRTIRYLFVLWLAGMSSYLINGGWYYTYYPFIAMAMVLSIAVCCRLVLACRIFKGTLRLLAGMILLLGLLGAGLYKEFADPIIWRAQTDMFYQKQHGHPFANWDMQAASLAKIETYFIGHPRFMFFATNMWAVDLLKEGSPRENVGRFDALWPLPGFLSQEHQQSADSNYQFWLAYFTGAIADDLARHKPDMVINDVSVFQRDLPPSYNVLTLLAKDPRFTAAWQNYTLVDKWDNCTPTEQADCAYEIYYRK